MNRSGASSDSNARWRELPECPALHGRVVSLVVRLGDERHRELESAIIDAERGLEGDRWWSGSRRLERQISLVSRRTLETLTSERSRWSDSGDNLVVDFDLSESNVPVGSQLEVGGAILGVSATSHLGCARFARRFGEEARDWVNAPANRHLRLRGVYCRVVKGGVVTLGDVVRRLWKNSSSEGSEHDDPRQR